MTRKFSILSVGLIAFSSAVFAQTGAKKPSSAPKKETGIAVAVPLPAPVDPVLLTVGGDAVTKSEFESIYHKNKLQKNLGKTLPKRLTMSLRAIANNWLRLICRIKT
jgi:hypothetical protein